MKTDSNHVSAYSWPKLLPESKEKIDLECF